MMALPLSPMGAAIADDVTAAESTRRHQTLYSLPYGCNTRRMRGGINYYYCGGIWYRPVCQGTTVVYIVDDIDEGANTNVELED